MDSRNSPPGLQEACPGTDAHHTTREPSLEIWLGKGDDNAMASHVLHEATLALLFLVTTTEAFTGAPALYAPQQRRAPGCSSATPGLLKQCVKIYRRPKRPLAMRGELRGVPPRLPGNREAVSMGSIAVDDAVERFYGQPAEDPAKDLGGPSRGPKNMQILVGMSLAVAVAAVTSLPVSAHVSAHTISGAMSGMVGVALLGNPLFGGSFGARMNHSFQNLVPLIDAAINKGVLCGAYAAVYGAITIFAPGGSATLCVVGSAAATALASTATEITLDRQLAKACELNRAYLLSRRKGEPRLAAMQQIWAQRRTRDAGGAKAFLSASKPLTGAQRLGLNVWGFEVFYLSWHALTIASPWVGATVPGHAVGAAIAGACYAVSLPLGEAFRDGLAANSAASLAQRLRAWVRAVRMRWSEMTLTSMQYSLRFAFYKVVYDSLVLA